MDRSKVLRMKTAVAAAAAAAEILNVVKDH